MKHSDSPVRLRALAGQLPGSLQRALEPKLGDDPNPRQIRQLALSLERTLKASLQVPNALTRYPNGLRTSTRNPIVETRRVASISKRRSGVSRWWTTFGACAGISVAVAAAAKFKSSFDRESSASNSAAIASGRFDQLRVKKSPPALHHEAPVQVSSPSELAPPQAESSAAPEIRRPGLAILRRNGVADREEPHAPERSPLSENAEPTVAVPSVDSAQRPPTPSPEEGLAHSSEPHRVTPDALLQTREPDRGITKDVLVGPAPTLAATNAESQARPPDESELGLLKRAQWALATNPGLALDIAATHARRFPSGALAQEREVIAVDALMRLGRTSEASRRGTAFQTRYPASAHARRIQVLLGSK